MALPLVAIVGRPNVGKSSLLNSLAGRMISIVDPTPGVTRDRVSIICAEDDRFFELVDTGGWGIIDEHRLEEQVEQQILFAVEHSAMILFITDAQTGVTPLDGQVAQLLRSHNCRVIPVANKVDSPEQHDLAGEMFGLGFGPPISVSALHGRGKDDLLSRIVDELPEADAEEADPDPTMKFAVVGRRNVGKSSFVNALADEPRVIVSEIPGTTRDAVDVQFEKDGRVYVAIDTAGVRRKSKTASDIEFYSYTRAVRSIRRADVVLFFIDASEPVASADKRLASIVEQEFKPIVLVLNKWDLVKDRATMDQYKEYLARAIGQIGYAPICRTTAIEDRNVQVVIDTAMRLYNQASNRVRTGPLNQTIEDIQTLRGPSVRGRRRPKIFYATQISVRPPTIALFVNDPALIDEQYQRFLINRFRERLPFAEIPIRLLIRARRPNRDDSPTRQLTVEP
jgi:GTP-binding protein